MSISCSSPRIAFFLNTVTSGGVERIFLNLSQGFLEKGFQVDLVLSSKGGIDLWTIPSNLRVVDLQSPKVSACLPKLVRYLQRERPISLLSALHYANEVAVVAKYLARVPTQLVVSEHTALSKDLEVQHVIRQHLIPLADRMLYSAADRIVAVSHGVAQDLSTLTGLPKDKITVIYNPSITPDIAQRASEPVDHPWFAPDQPPVILGVGRLEAQKDFPSLLRAFQQVRRARPARLMILGQGPDRPQLEALVQSLNLEDDVSFPGFVKNPFPYIAKADVFALSSRWEGLPTVLIEAMAVGTPVVSTDCKSGPAEILDGGKYGTLVPVGDSEALAVALLKVLEGQIGLIDRTWLNQFMVKTATDRYLDSLGASHLCN